ncbi:MAG: hypothetical protein AB8B94_05090 [Hyphomicrobiales bacterium]
MVKPPQRPTPKTGAQNPSTSGGGTAKSGAAANNNPKSRTSTQASAKRAAPTSAAIPDAKLTPKPTTIDLKANEVKKSASSSAAGAGTSSGNKASSTTDPKKSEPVKKSTTTAAPTPTEKRSASSASTAKSSASSSSTASNTKAVAPKDQSRGGTKFLALLLAGVVGGIVALLGAFALLGSGAISGLLAGEKDDQPDETQVQVGELSNDVSGLTDRINKLQDSLDETIASQNLEIPDLSGPLAVIEEEISAVQSQMNELISADNMADNTDDETLSAMQTKIEANASESSEKLTALSDQLSDLTARQATLENSVTAGDAGEAPALAALEQRLAALSDSQQAQGALVSPAVREELSTLEEELQKLQIQMAVMENLQLITEAQQTEIIELSTAVTTVAQKTDRLEASAAEEPASESALMLGSKLAYLQSALSDATTKGVPFVGLLAEATALLATTDSSVELPESLMQSATTGVLPLSVLATQIDAARAEFHVALSGPEEQNANEATGDDDSGVSADGVLKGIIKGAQSLVTIRSVEPPFEPEPADPISALLADAASAARSANLMGLSEKLDALAALNPTTAVFKDSLFSWQEQTKHHQNLNALSSQIGKMQQMIWAQAGAGERP